MSFVCGLLYSMSYCCLIVICFKSFAFCYVLINCFMFFNYSFYVCCLVLYVLLCVLCVLCFCIVLCIVSPMCIVVYFLFVYRCTNHCHRVETQLQLVNIISYMTLLSSECSLSLFSVTVISIHILLLHK